MSIYNTLIARGYFPKELPPSFFTDRFATYAITKGGRATLESYRPGEGLTECVNYRLALPGSARRDLGIPHPASFSTLAALTAKNFRRLLTKAGRSPFSKSRPVYSSTELRALRPSFKPSSLARERTVARSGSTFVVKADIGHFYPSLYTHAIGWAIDPKLREKAHWRDGKLLGKKVDQAVMNLQGKVSQGVPIGNDISFLLAEVVLADVDKSLKVDPKRAYRWFDDYEISCDSFDEAEAVLARLTKQLHRYRLRLNADKTEIRMLPSAAQEEWQQRLISASKTLSKSADTFVAYFDVAFALRASHSKSQVLTYALGLLFKITRPARQVAGVVQSGVTQALLSEPGVAQKGFALLSFWAINGFELDATLMARTVDGILRRHRASGVTSDVAWALAFCLEQGLKLSKQAGELLAECDDDCIVIQALHCRREGLLRSGFGLDEIRKILRDVDLDGEHWLLGYEALRHGFSKASSKAVKSNPLFKDLLKYGVTFYRPIVPDYAMVVHPGGAPEWTVRLWMDILQDRREIPEQLAKHAENLAVVKMMRRDLNRLETAGKSRDEAISALFERVSPGVSALLAQAESYV